MIEAPPLPHEPGCYLFSDRKGDILYVGKARDLKKRVSSYFRKGDPDQKIRMIREASHSVDIIVTGTEVEALILENNLIKKHQPKYNINLKDAKQYAYIELTNEKFPAIRIARQATGQGTYFGPFVSAAERDFVRNVVRKTFLLRTCRKLPRKACLRYHIHTCSAPCIGEVSAAGYSESVRKASMVLKGKTADLIADLQNEMAKCASSQEYEQALLLRNQIRAMERLSERQDVARKREGNEDVIAYILRDSIVYLMLFNIYRGTLGNKNEFLFGYHPDFFEEFLVQYYSDNQVPSEVILPEKVDASVAEFLTQRKGKKVTVTIPKQGVKKRLIDLVRKNIETLHFGDDARILELQEVLGLDAPPSVIECFDISHISGSMVVGSMVQFRNGRSDKKNYRRYRIRDVEGIDDPAAIAEVVRRRFRRLKAEETPLPDLVLVDGGKTQLNAAQRELRNIGLSIPVVAIAKKHEEIFVPGSAHPLQLQKRERSSLYLQEVRDEAHRFAVSYHRLLRRKDLLP
jgi:excinuclease ABC subunit C